MTSHAGTIGILTSEQGRFSRFWLRFMAMEIPARVKLISKMSLDIPGARDEVIRESEGDWVWFIDDDHTFQPDLLRNLLARDVDVVQPLVLGRIQPFAPVMMGDATADGKAQYRFGLMDEEEKGLKSCGAVGAAGMLIKRRVLDEVGDPWFSRGENETLAISEDIRFCRRAVEKGFSIYSDLDNRMGHLNIGEVWPVRTEDGKWATRITFGGQDIVIPKAESKYKIKDGICYPLD